VPVSDAVIAPGVGTSGQLPELSAVSWRPRIDERRLRRSARLWTVTTVAHAVPFVLAAGLLAALAPITIPVGVILIAHAWIIPELYAARGAGVVRQRPRSGQRGERRALGLLGDLVGHDARELHARTGLVLEVGGLGVWLVGERGALLVRPGARRVCCYCVRVTDPELPAGDQVAHLLLALRADEAGLATVANLAFCGARWRLRRRLKPTARQALDRAAHAARRM
jgi:hypothetical protein